jgi:hypothetical protein
MVDYRFFYVIITPVKKADRVKDKYARNQAASALRVQGLF